MKFSSASLEDTSPPALYQFQKASRRYFKGTETAAIGAEGENYETKPNDAPWFRRLLDEAQNRGD
jgi:hypothetical protein